MKVFAFLLGLLGLGFALAAAAAPALAQTQMPAIAAADAKAHVGQTVTVEGVVSEVHTAASGRHLHRHRRPLPEQHLHRSHLLARRDQVFQCGRAQRQDRRCHRPGAPAQRKARDHYQRSGADQSEVAQRVARHSTGDKPPKIRLFPPGRGEENARQLSQIVIAGRKARSRRLRRLRQAGCRSATTRLAAAAALFYAASR